MCSGVFEAVSHGQTGQGGTDGSSDGSVQDKGRSWWAVGSEVGDASDHQMVDCVLASIYD